MQTSWWWLHVISNWSRLFNEIQFLASITRLHWSHVASWLLVLLYFGGWSIGFVKDRSGLVTSLQSWNVSYCTATLSRQLCSIFLVWLDREGKHFNQFIHSHNVFFSGRVWRVTKMERTTNDNQIRRLPLCSSILVRIHSFKRSTRDDFFSANLIIYNFQPRYDQRDGAMWGSKRCSTHFIFIFPHFPSNGFRRMSRDKEESVLSKRCSCRVNYYYHLTSAA